MASDESNKDSISGRHFAAQTSVDSTIVEIRIDGVTLRVPRNYLQTALLSGEGKSVVILVTDFPNFHGATRETLRLFSSVWPRENLIFIYALGPRTRIDGQVRQRNHRALSEASAQQQRDERGLVKVSAKTSLVPQDVYVGYYESANAVVISCARPEDQPLSQSCSVYVEAKGLPFRYWYDAALLPNWRSIHVGFLALLDSFDAGGRQ